jgi:hypothetical protein
VKLAVASADFDLRAELFLVRRPREASAKDGPENSSNLASKSHLSLVSGPGKATFWTRVITCLLGKIFQKMSRKFEKSCAPTIRT